MAEVIFLNGTVGAGKTTVAEAVSLIESTSAVPHALIDLDHIRRLWPAPTDDPFNLAVELRNLRSIVANYRDAGSRRLVLAGVVEHASDLGRYHEALDTTDLLLCRLTVDPAAARERLSRRHAADPVGLDWHLRRTDTLAAVLDQAEWDDLVLDTTHRSPDDLARQVHRAAGWS